MSRDEGTGHLTLGVIAAGNFVQMGSRLLVGAILPIVITYFETSRSRIGIALTLMWVLYAVSQFPSGVLSDRIGERRLAVFALGVVSFGTILVALSPSVTAFALFLLVLGAGGGLFLSPALSLVSRLYTNQGTALGIVMASGGVAGVLFPVLGGVVGLHLGWRVALGVSGVFSVGVLLVTFLLVPAADPPNPDRRLNVLTDVRRHWQLLSRPGAVYTVAIGGAVGFAYQGTSSFLPTLLVESRNLGPDFAGLLFGLVFGLSSIAQPVAGRLSDVYSRDLLIGISAALEIAGIAAMLVAASRPGIVFGVALLGLGIAWPGPVQARIFEQVKDDDRGYGFGLLRSTYTLLGASGSVVVGVLSDIAGWTVAFGVICGVLGACLLLLGLNWLLSLGY